ncbi:hypothetical protein BLNAU_11621 [Blattamonas nauphoetae]|uniref:Uncharacterized protein n=1 Tax=Blattamonas nauphoetae TaxID=2049346 RepID=A0ABQ9XSA5_9EUKA|nr:hypothetical protein BLNAU_11621 [Blattamonas nauphoetae]
MSEYQAILQSEFKTNFNGNIILAGDIKKLLLRLSVPSTDGQCKALLSKIAGPERKLSEERFIKEISNFIVQSRAQGYPPPPQPPYGTVDPKTGAPIDPSRQGLPAQSAYYPPPPQQYIPSEPQNQGSYPQSSTTQQTYSIPLQAFQTPETATMPSGISLKE